MTTYLKREHTADELQAEIEGLEYTLGENKVYNRKYSLPYKVIEPDGTRKLAYREFSLINLIPHSGDNKGEMGNITIAQYQAIFNERYPSQSMLTEDGKHVHWESCFDMLAHELGYEDLAPYTQYHADELLRRDILKARDLVHQIAEYKQELKYIESEVSPMPEHTEQAESPQNPTTAPQKRKGKPAPQFEPFDPIKMDAAAKDFQADLTAILNDGNRATDLCALFSRYYLKAGHTRLGRILVKTGKGGK